MRALVVVLLCGGCTAAPDRGVNEPAPATSIELPESSSSSGPGDAESSGAPSTPPPPETTGAADGVGPGGGCQRIDFVFVIDNSSSMATHQASLLASFGPFMDTILDTVDARDYHVMVVDSDAGEDLDRACEPCPSESVCGSWCTAKQELDLGCETTLGAGEVAPFNEGASNRICGLPPGQRYIESQGGAASIKDLFACTAAVGIDGSSSEMPLSALVEAVTRQSAPQACNAGFLREDAILVVTLITDDYPVPHFDDDAKSTGSPGAWFNAIVDAKGGNVENIVMLGIINTADATCVSGTGDPIVHPTARFVDFVERFGERGLTGNICDASYVDFFADAVSLIDSTCDEFVPEG